MPKMRWCFTRFRYTARHGWPKMRWCFTRFRHAVRTARGGPKCVGASLVLGCAPCLRAYATRCCARTRLAAARVRDPALLRADATQVWVARGVMAFSAAYILKCILHMSVVNRRTGASGGGPKCVGASLSLRRPRLGDSRGKGLGGDRVSQLRAGALGAGPAASRKDGRVVLARSGGSGPGRGSPRPGRPVASRLRGGSGP